MIGNRTSRPFRRTVALAAGALFLTAATAACAPDDSASGAAGDDDVLTVGVDPHFPPDEFTNSKGEYVGWEIDLMNAVAKEMDTEVKFESTAFDSLIPGLGSGRYDAIIGNLGVTAERLAVVDIVTVTQPDLAFLAAADSGIKIKTLDDLCGVELAVTRGSTQDLMAIDQSKKCTDAGDPPIERKVYQSGDQNILAVQSGRAEVYWTSHSRAVYYEDQKDADLVIAGWHERGNDLTGFALDKGSDLSESMLDAVNALIDDGTYMRVLKKWGLEGGAVEESQLNPTEG